MTIQVDIGRSFSSLLWEALRKAPHKLTYLKTNDPRVKKKKKSYQVESHNVFYNLNAELTYYHFYLILWVTQPWNNIGGDYTKVWVPGGEDH